MYRWHKNLSPWLRSHLDCFKHPSSILSYGWRNTLRNGSSHIRDEKKNASCDILLMILWMLRTHKKQNKKNLKKEWNSRRSLTISIGQCCLTSGHYQKKWTDCYTSNDQINNIVPIYLVVSRPLSEAQLEFYYSVTVTGK